MPSINIYLAYTYIQIYIYKSYISIRHYSFHSSPNLLPNVDPESPGAEAGQAGQPVVEGQPLSPQNAPCPRARQYTCSRVNKLQKIP